MSFSEEDRHELQCAKNLLENPGFVAKLTNIIGMPIEAALARLPNSVTSKITVITQSALMKALDAAVFTMKDVPGEKPSNLWHKAGIAVSGGVGGFFGFAGLSVELPLSTSIMLRSIADIARSHEERIDTDEAKQACLAVFALGGRSSKDDDSETGYYTVRAALAKSLSDGSILKLVATIAERFSVNVGEKAAAQAIPAIGAVGGALINLAFINHFQDMAHGHFIIRKLERRYGQKAVQQLYQSLSTLAV
ncbi:EcsC family protein [Pseudomonas gingeri]|uniref:EcsC family protein n=1 Tax=Pseudomonas gingeri TaxID=117681 RepID=A0A7Y8C2U5_9PSED|nr:EcsC family protein [Pseudomonas gingeri]NWA24662.1 EcsC family protein [Pseudomonas gingeri]NWB96722.1 EcsC family protein [Pseudomonas gingeri]NWD67277.1 EcsC family protein [Pseudomonas gingeri]NWD77960.1 EcsC family protein [Pseudomonas gingeri]